MLFDSLCGAAERGLLPAPFPRLLKEAKIFEFPMAATEMLPIQALFSEHLECMTGSFFLPFPVTVVADPQTTVLLADMRTNVIGLNQPRWFVDAEYIGEQKNRAGEVRITWGQIVEMVCDDPTKAHFNTKAVDLTTLIVSGKDARVVDGLEKAEIDRAAMQNVVVALMQTAYCNLPSRFIVEKRPAKMHQPAKGRIARSGDRPGYTLLTPQELRKLFKYPEGHEPRESGSPGSHWRRKHPHTFKHDRFAASGLLGKTIFMPACWVGPKEVQVGKWTYVVHVDL